MQPDPRAADVMSVAIPRAFEQRGLYFVGAYASMSVVADANSPVMPGRVRFSELRLVAL